MVSLVLHRICLLFFGFALVSDAAILIPRPSPESLSRPETIARRPPVINYCHARNPPEPIIEPALPIIDPHQHFFDPPQPYLLPELIEDISTGHNITKTVFVECGLRKDPLEEVRQVETFRQNAEHTSHPGIGAGIVGAINLRLGVQVESLLRQQMDASPKFRGVRMWPSFLENFTDPDVRAAVGVVDKLGLLLETTGSEFRPLDLWAVDGAIANLARDFPTLTIVVDHVGGALGPKEFRNKTILEDWEAVLRKLASHPNVKIKVGGLQMESNGFNLHGRKDTCKSSKEIAKMMLPYYRKVINIFGVNRCMFESNYPMDKWGVDYRTLWNTFKRIAAEIKLSPDEKAAIFHDTAAAVYKL